VTVLRAFSDVDRVSEGARQRVTMRTGWWSKRLKRIGRVLGSVHGSLCRQEEGLHLMIDDRLGRERCRYTGRRKRASCAATRPIHLKMPTSAGA
jgi:hypothetical protein